MKFFLAYPKTSLAAIFLLLALAVFSLYRSGRPPAIVEKDLKTIHKDMVRQAEQLGGTLDAGARVVVLELDYAFKAHGDRVYTRVFEALTKRGLTIQHVEHLLVDRERGWLPDQPGFPYAEYIRVAQEFPDAAAVIALCGAPYNLMRSSPGSDATRPKLLVAGGINGGIAESQFKQGWLHAATVPRIVTENGKRVLIYELLSLR